MGAQFADVGGLRGRQIHTWRPLKQINLTLLRSDGAESSSALSKNALATTVVVEGRHGPKPVKSRLILRQQEDPNALE